MASHTTYTLNLAASTKTANLLAGELVEFVPYPALVRIFAVTSALGVNIIAHADSDIAVDDKEIPFVGATLNNSDHEVDRFMVRAGTRLGIFLRETAAAGTLDIYTRVEITPLSR